MKCIGCNLKLEDGIGHYRTDSGPLCVVCHDKEIESNELKLRANFQRLPDRGIMKGQDETNWE
jgi:hypothetical protein